jgi:carboxylesterase type B
MCLDDSDITGNMGFLDQHTALKWVYENIAAFGGDPNRITLAGRSAGSFSIGYHMIHPPSWPYMKQVVLQSGSILYSKMDFMSVAEASRRTNGILDNLGCSNSWSITNRVACLRNQTLITAALILNISNAYENLSILRGVELAAQNNPLYHLVLNGREFNERPRDAFANGRFKSDLNMLNGYNHDEGGYFVKNSFFGDHLRNVYTLNESRFNDFLDAFYMYFPTFPTPMPQEFKRSLVVRYTNSSMTDFLPALIQLLGEHSYICPSVDFTSFYAAANESVKVFRFLYDHRSSAAARPVAFGVIHGEERLIW